MRIISVKIKVLSTVLAASVALGIGPAAAQTLSIAAFPDSGVLVSRAQAPRISGNRNLETSLVDITAVDPATLQEHDGKLAKHTEQRSGQGIIIDPTGIIVTNRHIVGDVPEHIYVMLTDGTTYDAKIIENSPNADLSLIKVNAPYPLRAVALADSSHVQIGNHVHAFANAELNTQRKYSGEIIQVYRETSSDTVAILAFNIPLKPGDSGGPIVDEQGLLLGLIMANQKSDPSKSYAIASNKIQQEYLKYKGSTLISSL